MIDVQTFSLPNGLSVFLLPSSQAPLVAVDLVYHTGSKNETWGLTGFAHLFEHLMFEGSAHAPGKLFDQYIQNAGGENNAYTTEDLTNYYEIMPSHQLELALWLESDRMRFLNITQESLDAQRDVVIEERKQRVDNQPYGRAMESITSRLYKNHPYRWPVIGHIDHLMTATLDDVRNFYQKFYAPDHASLVLSGDFDRQQVEDLVQKYFGEFSATGPNGVINADDEPLTDEIRDVIEDQIQLPALFMAYRTVSELHPDYAALDLVSDILSNGKSSRLYQNLVYQKQMAQTAVSFQEQNEHPGAFILYAIARPDVSLRTVESAIQSEIEQLATREIEENILQKVKNLAVSSLINRLQGVANRADFYARFCGLYKNPDLVNSMMNSIQSVTPADIKRVTAQYLTGKNRVVLDFVPRKKQ